MAEKNFGAAFYMAAVAAPAGPVVKLAEVLSVKAPSLSRGTIDTTTHDSVDGIMEFMGEGVADPGELTIQVHRVPGGATDTACIAAVTAGVALSMKVTSNGRDAQGAAIKMQTAGIGIVTAYEPDDQPVQGKQTATVSIKASGKWVQGPFAA
ncbi:MAG: hypothetical protein EOP94_00570 [Zymomonas sp.]|nr:MAG: hypothetical protein EOP94_00570 [Zymomonas sp.]